MALVNTYISHRNVTCPNYLKKKLQNRPPSHNLMEIKSKQIKNLRLLTQLPAQPKKT